LSRLEAGQNVNHELIKLADVEAEFAQVLDDEYNVLAQAETIVVASADQAEEAKLLAKTLKHVEKAISEKEKELTAPLKREAKRISDYAKQLVTPFSRAANLLSAKVMTWQQEEMRLQRERQRIAERGREAALLANQKPVTPLVQEKPVEKIIATRKTLKFEIVNIDVLPRECMMPNETYIRSILMAGKGVEGVRSWYEETPIFR
jgi:hypothetical protein